MGGPRGAPQSARRLRTRLSNGREPPTLRRARPEGPRTPPKGAGTAGRRQWGVRSLRSGACKLPPDLRRARAVSSAGLNEGLREGAQRPSQQAYGPPPSSPCRGAGREGCPAVVGGLSPMGPCRPPLGRGASKAARATYGRPPIGEGLKCVLCKDSLGKAYIKRGPRWNLVGAAS